MNNDTLKEVLWSIRGFYSAIWSIPLKNVKWHSDPWLTVTSTPIRLSTNFTTFIPILTFTDYEWFPWSICNGCGMPAGNAYPSGHLVPSPIVGLVCAPIVETRFLELAMSLLDFPPRIPLGTFSILLDDRGHSNWSPIVVPQSLCNLLRVISFNALPFRRLSLITLFIYFELFLLHL